MGFAVFLYWAVLLYYTYSKLHTYKRYSKVVIYSIRKASYYTQYDATSSYYA